MPWRPLPRIAFAVCTYPFAPSSPNDLPLQIGDELYIFEQGGENGSWFRGYLVSPPSLLAGLTSVRGQALEARVFSGIFPRSCVEIREILGDSSGRADGAAWEDDNGELQDPDQRASRLLDDLDTWPSPPQSPPPAGGGLTAPVPFAPSTDVPSSTLSENIRKHKRSQSEAANRASVDGPAERPAESAPAAPTEPKPPAPVPMLKIGDESWTSKSEPLVDEIASCLREWHSLNIHELLLTRQYGMLDTLSQLVDRLDSTRRQLLHKVLTNYELQELRDTAIWDLVSGNKILSGDVIVRSLESKGRILTGEDSAVDISRLQTLMSLLDERPVTAVQTDVLHHLLLDLKQFPIDEGKVATYAIGLYTRVSGDKLRPISEVFAVDTNSARPLKKVFTNSKTKTLFTDLTVDEAGDGTAAFPNVYLVIRMIASEAQRVADPAPSRDGSSQGEARLTALADNLGSWRTSGFKIGRRTTFLGSKTRRDTEEREGVQQSRADVGPRAVGTAESRPSTSKGSKPVKRTVGVGIINISDILKRNREAEQTVKIWSTTDDSLRLREDVDPVDPLVKDIFPTPDTAHVRHTVVVQCKPFINADSDTLVQSTPTLLHEIQRTQRIGFAGAPTKQRSDIYITVCAPALLPDALLYHPRSGRTPLPTDIGMANLHLTLEVRNSDGDRIENCIYPSCNSAGHTAWRTNAIDRAEMWNQTIRLAINPEDVPGSHLVMSVADAYNFPFALCWMPLWTQEAFVRDGDHSLALYKYDEYTSSMIAGKGAYLSLPWSSKTKDESVTGPVASLHLRTFLCSTKYSQDPDLLGLLQWHDQKSRDLLALLKRFAFVPEIEIVKLLYEVFDSLFEVMVEYAENDEIEDHVFSALVVVLGIVFDRRFNLQPLLQDYSDNHFKYPFAFPCLVRSFNRLLHDVSDQDTSRKLRSLCKVAGHVFKLITTARDQQIIKKSEIGINSLSPSVAKDLEAIFTSVEDLMRNPASTLIGTKTLIVQNFHTWLPPLAQSMSPEDLFSIASNFVDSCGRAQGKLLLYKLILIIHLSELSFVTSDTMQAAWVNNIRRWLEPHWGFPNSVSSQWRDQVRLCCSVVAANVKQVGSQPYDWAIGKLITSYKSLQRLPKQPGKTFSPLYPKVFPFPIKATNVEAKYDESLIEVGGLLADLAYTNIEEYQRYPEETLRNLILECLSISQSLLDLDAFPASWLSLHVLHHKTSLKGLQQIAKLLRKRFLPDPDDADEFDIDLWKTFFTVLLGLINSEALALETFPEQRRRAVWKIGGDIRGQGAQLLLEMWDQIGWETSTQEKKSFGLDNMGGYQVQYVPGLVGPILELCLSVHEGLRRVAISILQTMIISEWQLNQDLTTIQAEIIERLDHLFRTRKVNDGVIQKIFIAELVGIFQPLKPDESEGLYEAVKDLFSSVDQLLDLLIAVHSPSASGDAFQLMDTLKLMEFLRDMQKERMYVEYIHKLAQAQADTGNPSGAGLALRMHADLYEWDTTKAVPAFKEPRFGSQSAFERKEQVYFLMIRHFEDAAAWHLALRAYRELAYQYENTTFDFPKLARAQRAMASIYDRISKGDQQTHRYFRVIYRGLGFPPNLRDKQFIFEAQPNEKLGTFSDRMQQVHPSAQVVSSSAIENLEGQYLSVYPVSAQKDLLHAVNRRSKVSRNVRDHHLLAHPNQFSFTSKRQASTTGPKDQVLEKVVFTTADRFPTILRRSEVIKVETVKLTPLQIGLERTLRKTNELLTLQSAVPEGGDAAMTTLTEAITILVNASSNGSVAEYWSLIPDVPTKLDVDGPSENGSREGSTSSLAPLEEALRASLFDHVLAIQRGLECYTRAAHHATKAELTRGLEKTFKPVLNAMQKSSLSIRSETPHIPVSATLSPPSSQKPFELMNGAASPSEGTMSKTTALSPLGIVPATRSPVATHDFDGKRQGGGTNTMKSDVEPLKSMSSNVTNPLFSARASVAGSINGIDDLEPNTKKTALGSGISARMGSVTKRLSNLSGLGIGKKSSKQDFKNRTISTVPEV